MMPLCAISPSQPPPGTGEETEPFRLKNVETPVYGLVVLWYFANGSAREDINRARRRSPWYREKSEPSFGDMIAALRRHLGAERNFSEPHTEQDAEKLNADFLDWLCAA